MAHAVESPGRKAPSVEEVETSTQSRSNGIHWLTPVSMIAALVVGSVFAVGHHLFYKSLSGEPVKDDITSLVGVQLSDQQRNIAIGNGFALIVRSFLVIALGIAYLQLVWHFATKDRSNVAVLDVQFSALSSALSLGNLVAWKKNPLLFVVALLAWILPIASVFTPATLSVGAAKAYQRAENVSQVDYKSLKLLANMGVITRNGAYGENYKEYGINPWYRYMGPSIALKEAASASLSQDTIVPITPPAANSSWTLDFDGPAILCRPHNNASNIERFKDNVFEYVKSQWKIGQISECTNAPALIGWPGWVTSYSGEMSLPFAPAGTNSSEYVFTNGQGKYGDHESLFVASIPAVAELSGGQLKACSRSYPASNDTLKEQRDYLFAPQNPANPPEPLLLQCDLYEASYHVDFRFLNGIQQTSTTVTNYSAKILETQSSGFKAQRTAEDEGRYPDLPCRWPAKADSKMDGGGPTCTFSESQLSHTSYMAVFESFLNLLTGTVSSQSVLASPFLGPEMVTRGGIANHGITRAQELAFVSNMSRLQTGDDITSGVGPVAQGVGSDGNLLYPSLVDYPVDGLKALPLQDLLEEKFRNLTLSLMSFRRLQPNETSAYFPPATTVTFTMSENIYVYSEQKLWLVYGIAIASSLAVVIAGLLVIILNGVAYSNVFSTFLRLSRGAYLDTEIQQRDLDGRDPLPEYLAEATVEFVGSKGTRYRTLATRSDESSLDS